MNFLFLTSLDLIVTLKKGNLNEIEELIECKQIEETGTYNIAISTQNSSREFGLTKKKQNVNQLSISPSVPLLETKDCTDINTLVAMNY